MAEVIGAVASGMSIAAFAGQIASSVLKLKSYIDQVKDAPEDIKIMVEEIEDLQLLLSDIEDDQARYPHSEILAGSKSLSRCLNNCKRGVDRLQRLVDEISLDFKSAKSLRHKTVSMKFIWKKDKLVRYRAELAATVRLLSLSYQIYTKSLIQVQPEIITLQMAQLVQTSSPEKLVLHSSGNSQNNSLPTRTKSSAHSFSTAKGHFLWRWKSYSLLLGHAWDLAIVKSCQGWNFTMSMYAVVSSDSELVRFAEEGNIAGLKNLFSEGKATPFTTCCGYYERTPLRLLPLPSTKSLLEIGLSRGDYDMCKFLMSQGVSLAEDSQICNGPFKYLIGASIDYLASAASENYVAQGKDPTGDLESLANMVIPKCEVSLNTLKHFSGPSWLFSLLLKNIDPLLMEEAAFRTSIARHLSWRPCLVTPEIIRLALGEKVLKNPTTGSPLHYVAHAVGFTFAYVALGSPLKNGYLSPADCLSDWFSIAQDLVIHGIGLNGLDLYQETPLQQLFWGIYIGFLSVTIDPTESMPDNPRKIEMSQLTVLLRNYWLTPLKSFGVDLAKYGEEEKRTPGSGNWKALFNRWTFRIGFVLIPSFMGYQFGPEPDDWVLYWNEPTDRFAGEFWKMIEQGKGDEVMPGTWVD